MRHNGKHSIRFTHIIAALIAGLVAVVHAGESNKKEIGRTTEKELNVVLSSSFGKVTIARGETEKIVVAQGSGKDDAVLQMSVDYNIRNRVGYLELSLGEDTHVESDRRKGSFSFSNLDGGTWDLKFSNAIPISFDLELGVAKGDFDLSGLQVKDFKLSAGASDVALTFNKLNTSSIDEMTVECGVGKFVGKNLGNANFKRFRFEAGLGASTLDFSGQVQNEVDVDVQVGMGVCTIILPKDVGAKVYFEESLVSKLDCEKGFRVIDDNERVSDNFKTAAGRMNIRIDAGMGRVKIKRSQ